MSKKNQNKWQSQKPAEPKVEEVSAVVAEEVQPIIVEEAEDLIDFDGWWAARQTRVPGHHHMEIIKADFKGRGLRQKETMASFDKALEMYGVKLS